MLFEGPKKLILNGRSSTSKITSLVIIIIIIIIIRYLGCILLQTNSSLGHLLVIHELLVLS